MGQISTKADPGARGWAINDEVVRFRVIGTETVYDLGGAVLWTLGASDECSIKLLDPSGRVSRRHAGLERRGRDWILTDLGSTNGIRHDGENQNTFAIVPGAEIQIGGVKLIAESARSIELRVLLCRFLGWSPGQASEVDRALGAVRDLGNLRTTLILRGEGALVGVARNLHARIAGPERPFSIHAPDETAMQALARGLEGSLFVDAERLPADVLDVLVSLRLPDTRVRLVVGANSDDAAAEISTLTPHAATIWIPPLSERLGELDRILEAYAADATARLHVSSPALRPHDLKWIRESGIATHADIEEVMLRVVAMRNWGVTEGATKLGITHGALSRWARRRKIPT